MSLHDDLLKQAEQLAIADPRKPRQASLRRAVSAAYYALFHKLVDQGTVFLVSRRRRSALRACLARAFAHATMRQVAQQFAANSVSPKLRPGLNGQTPQPELRALAEAFVDLQQARHEADYNRARRFTRREALDQVELARCAFADWETIRSSPQADTFLTGLLVFRNIQG